ncbi:MAG: threonine ammonia-lyase, biosynthetic, partial [Pseudomonadota bacterium]|nr:threonine ammonia-lyase, biosynthetic [Pseudomonadota bacterium]
MMSDYLERILTAHVYDVAIESPLTEAPRLSARTGNRVLFKREDLQPVFSFKLRGAYNKMARLNPAELARGVIAASAGNHAQGVALGAQRLGTRALIVMPETTPQIKVDAVRSRGAEVILEGTSYDDAYQHALKLAEQRGLTFIHPYDDPDVIAGQGTIGMEILRQHQRPIDAVFLAVGGGGLIAGVASYIKRISPQTRIIGVQPVDSDAMTRSLAAGHRVRLEQVGLFADGVAVKLVGEETFRLCQTLVDEMVLVDTDAICAALKDVFDDTRSVLEPAGALAVAGLKAWVEKTGARDQTLVAVACGANMNFDRLHFVAERAELGEHREALFAATIPEQPGSFLRFCESLGRRNITEFGYRYSREGEAHVFVGVGVANQADIPLLLQGLKDAGIATIDLSDNELAKLHVRHLVGGRTRRADDERLFRFEFPERPGALIGFLQALGSAHNISLFHYRNHGADTARVLIGFDLPAPAQPAFLARLASLPYPWVDET